VSDKVRATIAVLTTVAMLAMLLYGVHIPAEGYAVWGVVVGYYFGRPTANGAGKKV